jgi:peptidylprolyl isomerase
MNRAFAFSLAMLAIFTVVGCNKLSKPAVNGPSSTTGGGASANIRQLKELRKTDVEVGKGAAVAEGDTVYVTYTGKLKDGTEFDSNDSESGTPYALVIGAHSVIQGWEIGLVGMKVGGTRKLEVPTDLAYGNQGSGEKVPPGADLYFTIKLDDAIKVGEEAMFDKRDIRVGSGKEAKLGSLVDVNYTLKLVNGRIADSRQDLKKPVTFRIGPKIKDGDRLVPSGLSSATIGMREGGVRFMRIPPIIGFVNSTNTAIPPNSLVLIEMTLRRVH